MIFKYKATQSRICRTTFLSLQDGSMVKGAIHQTQGPEFNPQYFHGTKTSQQLSHNLTHVHYHTCSPTYRGAHKHIHTNKNNCDFHKKTIFFSFFVYFRVLATPSFKKEQLSYSFPASDFFLQERESTYAFSYCLLLNTNDSTIQELFNT